LEYLELDRGEASEAVLPASAVVGVLDPGDDREPELLPDLPAAPVEDVLLQQREERLHRRVVGAGPDAAHRAAQLVVVEGLDEGVGPELAAAVGMHHSRDRSASQDGAGEGADGQLGGHPVGHGVADDPSAAGILDRAEVKLPLRRGVFGDVGQPQPVDLLGGEARSTRSS
jgi:hypothetical protein